MDPWAYLVNAILWRLGGAGKWPFKRHWRRVGYPVLSFILALSWGHSLTFSLTIASLCHASTRLPLTLIGNSLYTHWINWPWVWVVGYILGLPAIMTHGWDGLLRALLPAFAQGWAITLSNIPSEARDWPHEACEVLIGFVVLLAIF